MESNHRPSLLWRLFVLVGLGTAGAVTFSDEAADLWEDATGGAVPRDVVKGVFFGALGLHAGESLLAYIGARRAGLDRPCRRWAFGTLIWGFPVLRRLRKTKKAQALAAA